MKRWNWLLATILAALLAWACAPAPTPVPLAPKAAAPTPTPAPPTPTPKPPVSFAGKTVTILVPWSVGGAADIRARQIQLFLQKYLPGNPTVVVQNMPGGGGILGDNWVYNVAPKDGTVIGQPSIYLSNAVMFPEKAKYDLTKVQFLGAVDSTSPSFLRTDVGIKSAEELPKAAKKIFFGGTGGADSRRLQGELLLRILGVDHEIVSGYGSSGDIRAAVRRGELNMGSDGLEGYVANVKPMVAEGLVFPLAQDGVVTGGQIVRDPRLADIPTFTELAVKLKGEAIKGTLEFRAMDLIVRLAALKSIWYYPPGVPPEMAAAAATALEKVFADAEFLQTFEKATGVKPVFVKAAAVKQQADGVVELSKKETEALQFLKKLAE